ncbi:putative secondary metabolism biosyntheticenzyme [Clathrus columnatus]|uniref:Secondary metabolism biosyntheticenzyme n=1 Tax=Clathrus columnatus TaxID=1419009 RepID=A0AAV5A464_9AGAM|nr:putative secondary metabolism biosyntheticenzyme [Clathrus columnatus]
MTSSTVPPLKYTIDQTYDWHRVHTPNDPAIFYLNRDDSKETITWETLWKGIIKGTEIVKREIPELQDGNPDQKPMVVAFLALTDAPTYITFLYAHFRLTHPSLGRPVLPFLISPTNSTLGVANLIEQTNTGVIWVSDGPMKNLAEEALKTNPELKTRILNIPSFEDLYHPPITENISAPFDGTPVDPETPLLILHSSGREGSFVVFQRGSVLIKLFLGSTSFPKPRYLRHIIAREWAVAYGNSKHFLPFLRLRLTICEKERRDVSIHGEIIAVSPPVYHGMGVLMSFWMAGSRVITALNSPYGPSSGPISSDAFLNIVMKTGATFMLTTPNFLEDWSDNPVAVDHLKGMKTVIWGGGPLLARAGTHLHNEGVPLFLMYGTTETGLIYQPLSIPIKEGYEWFAFSPHANIYLEPTDEEGVVQVIVGQNDIHHLNITNTELNGVPAYNTNDLVEKHPEKDIYRFVGRSDDQIILNTGRKDVIYFGRARATNGILVQPKSFEEAEKLGVAGFRNLIWEGVEEANAYAPSHSRIFKEMILIATANKPFAYTAKQTLKKGVMIEAYADEINDLYDQSQSSVRVEIPIPLGTHLEGGWTEEESRNFVHQVVHVIMKDKAKKMTDDDDIFAFGCDSLLATYIRNTLLNALRQVAPQSNIDKLPTNFVYNSPSISQLTRLLTDTSRFELASEVQESKEAQQKRLETLVIRYTQSFLTHKPEKEMSKDEVIFLTGSTGGLGSQMLAQLIVVPTVTRVYAFNTPNKNQSSHERHVESFTDRGNNLSLLESTKVIFVEGDTSISGFAIAPELYEEMRSSVTTVIHNAWTSTQPIPEEPFLDINRLNGIGYTQSKWISERILTIAGDDTPLEPVIVRVGQLAGGLNGNWNVREWFPSLLAASQSVGVLPSCEGLASYIPVHIAASAMLDLRHASTRFAHLVHPKPIQFNELVQIISEDLKLSTIPYNEWVNRLEDYYRQNHETAHSNPAFHLLDFFKISIQPENFKVANQEFEAMGWAIFETTKTVEASPSLRASPKLDRRDVEQWLSYWRQKQVIA